MWRSVGRSLTNGVPFAIGTRSLTVLTRWTLCCLHRADGCSNANAQLRGCDLSDDEELTVDEWLALDDSRAKIGDGVQHDSGSEREDEWSTSSGDESAAPGVADEAFDVEKICDVRRRGALQALVEWSGSNGGVPWASSWEPLENLGPGLQREATAIWERRKAARRKRGRRNRPNEDSAREAQATQVRATAVATAQREARKARAERGRKRGDKRGGSGHTTRKRGRERGD